MDTRRVGAELDSAGMSVGTGKVELEGGDPGTAIELGDDVAVLLDGEPHDIQQHASPGQPRGYPRQILLPYPHDSRIGKSHGVEHASGKLGDPRGRVAITRLPGNRLRDQSAETLEVENSVQLFSETSRAGS
jgi:hypothetical protein